MFSVTGYLDDGLAYAATVGQQGRANRPLGCLSGPPHLTAMMLAANGMNVAVTPTGPFYILDLADPESVLAALYALTDVISVDGDDVPDVLPPFVPDRVY